MERLHDRHFSPIVVDDVKYLLFFFYLVVCNAKVFIIEAQQLYIHIAEQSVPQVDGRIWQSRFKFFRQVTDALWPIGVEPVCEGFYSFLKKQKKQKKTQKINKNLCQDHLLIP